MTFKAGLVLAQSISRLGLLLVVMSSAGVSNGVLADTFIFGAQNIDYYPHYRFKDKQDRGYMGALFEEFAKRYGHSVTYVAYPTKRLNLEMSNGQIDFIYPENPAWQSKEFNKKSNTIYSDAIITSFGNTMVLPERLNTGIKSFSSVAVPLGFVPVMYAELVAQNKVTIVNVPDAIAALRMVLLKRVDGADVERNVANHLLANMGQENALVSDPNLPSDAATFHLATLKHPLVIQQFNEFMEKNQTLIIQLKQRYKLIEPTIPPQSKYQDD